MSTAKKAEKGVVGTMPTVTDAKTVAKRLTLSMVGLKDDQVEVQDLAGLPDEFKNSETLSGFPPSPEWKEPGQALFGYFIGMREKIGPNESRLYEISVPRKGEDPLTVAVWGSAALDRLFDSSFPPIRTGDKLGFIFLGEKPTKRGLNPVKLFALKIARADGRTSQAHAG